MTEHKIYFVMPAYNEAANIEEVVNQWYPVVAACGPQCRLVIANDGSRDNTGEILRFLAESHPQLTAIDKPNSGHGPTLLYLYRHAIANGATHVFQTDSDGQTIPSEFNTFLNNINRFPLQIGVRANRRDGASRVFVTKTLKTVLWLTTGARVKDANTPFRLIEAPLLEKILSYMPEDFFLANAAMSAIAVKWNVPIGWHRITFRPRQGGVNSINMRRIFKIGVKALGDFKIIRRNLRNNPTHL